MGRDRTGTAQAKAWTARARADNRRTLNGVLHVLKTACAWEDLPREYGAPTTCWRRLQASGAGRNLGARVACAPEPAGCPRQARVGHRFPGRQPCASEKGGDAVGKTKVGKGSKVMVVADGQDLPIGLHVASARPHQSQLAEAALATVRVPRARGRPRTRLKGLVADKAYDSQAFRRALRRRGIKPTIPTFARRSSKRAKRGRPIRTGPSYCQRWKVERCFGWMDNYRRLVVRYERAVEHDKTFCLIAIILWYVQPILKYLVIKPISAIVHTSS
jgi:transposase